MTALWNPGVARPSAAFWLAACLTPARGGACLRLDHYTEETGGSCGDV